MPKEMLDLILIHNALLKYGARPDLTLSWLHKTSSDHTVDTFSLDKPYFFYFSNVILKTTTHARTAFGKKSMPKTCLAFVMSM